VDVRLRFATKQQLEDVGFNIDLQVVDWATLVKRRNNSKEYDAFTTGIGAIYDPTHVNFSTATWPGWTTDETSEAPGRARAGDRPQEAHGDVGAADRQFYEKVPVIRYGDLAGFAPSATRQGLQREDRAHPLLQRVGREVA